MNEALRGPKKIKRGLFTIRKYSEWKNVIQKDFGIDLKDVNVGSFRTDYKRLYVHHSLHKFASKGIIRHRHIRHWQKIEKNLHRLPPNPQITDLDKYCPEKKKA